MNKTIIFLSTAVLWFGSMKCRSTGEPWDATFYTTNGSGTWQLYINNKKAGTLPFIDAKPDCENNTVKLQGLSVQLPSGEYNIDVKDANGKTGFSGSINIVRNHSNTTISSSTQMRRAGVEMASRNECLVNKIYFP